MISIKSSTTTYPSITKHFRLRSKISLLTPHKIQKCSKFNRTPRKKFHPSILKSRQSLQNASQERPKVLLTLVSQEIQSSTPSRVFRSAHFYCRKDLRSNRCATGSSMGVSGISKSRMLFYERLQNV
jgi:hypothetical protein